MTLKHTLRRWSPLFLISSLSLFLELAVIRWLAAEVRLFSYFKNLPLLAAFLGLAIGFALIRATRNYWSEFAPMFGLFVALVLLVGRVISPRTLAYPSGGEEFLWFTGDYSYWLALLLFLSVVLIFFLLTVFIFIPLGQAIGKEMTGQEPIRAYIVNLLASLVGIWMFAWLSYLQTPPAIWFGMALLGIGLYLAGRRVLPRTAPIIFAAVVVALVFLGQGSVWSPYHRLDVTELFLPRQSGGVPIKVGYTLRVQQVFYQVAMDLSPESLAKLHGEIPSLENAAYSYNLPYRLLPTGAQVLIVGAGMGNDVAAALRNGAGYVDAVEIDPVISALGRKLHPEHPYDDPRVTLTVDDARSFFQRSSDRYDLVVFGLLDSHTLLSGLSNVRLDSFVYTIESFEQVRDHLNASGLVAVTFGADVPWIDERIGRMLVDVFGSENVFVYRGGIGTSFIAGLTPPQVHDTRLVIWHPDAMIEELPLTTDDWPYLYLRAQKVPAAYWQMLLLIGVACLAVIARSFPQALRPNWHFWLLGAAFLLIEFKSITELALLFGTTWLVNALAISGVLMMALLANLVVLRRPHFSLGLVYLLLFTSAIGSMVLMFLPLFFAGVIFGESLRRAGEAAGPLASNLSGSVVGGVLEYGSLIWGIKSLYVLAATTYVGALIAYRNQRE